jgi:hypothetical protein
VKVFRLLSDTVLASICKTSLYATLTGTLITYEEKSQSLKISILEADRLMQRYSWNQAILHLK